MILFEVTLEAGSLDRDGLIRLMRRTMAASQAEAGCLAYRFTADLDDPRRFHLVELWESEAALQVHAKGSTFRSFLAELPGLGRLVSSVARQGALEPYTFARPQ